MKKLASNNQLGNMSDTGGLKHDNETERFRPREWTVLLTIIALNSLVGMASSVEQGKLKGLWTTEILSFWQLCHTLVHIPAAIIIAMMSDLHGRKPIFIILFSFSILAAIFRIMTQETCIIIGLLVQGLVDGGTIPMTYLTISEYSRPKHRFVYLMLNAVMLQIAANVVHILYQEVLDKDSVYVTVVAIVLGLVGLGSVCLWPESPYWLDASGRRGDAACALRWLRGASAEPELSQLDHRTSGSFRVYCLSLFVAIITISISLLTLWQDVFLTYIYNKQTDLMSPKSRLIISILTNIISFTILALISYKVRRKILFLVAASIPLVISFVPVAWNRLRPIDENVDNSSFYIVLCIAFMLKKHWSAILAMALYIEVIPFKYNTHMSCICIVYRDLLNTLFNVLINEHRSAINTFTIMFMVLPLVGVLLYFWKAPETKDKSLHEIQNSYTPKGNTVEHDEFNQVRMQNIELQNAIERF